MDQVDTLHAGRYWSKVLCCTIMTHPVDIEVKVTDLDILIDLVAKHKSGELCCPATALIHFLLNFSSELINLGKTRVAGEFCGPFGSDKPTHSVTKYGLDKPQWLRDALHWLFAEPVLLPIFFILL